MDSFPFLIRKSFQQGSLEIDYVILKMENYLELHRVVYFLRYLDKLLLAWGSTFISGFICSMRGNRNA